MVLNEFLAYRNSDLYYYQYLVNIIYKEIYLRKIDYNICFSVYHDSTQFYVSILYDYIDNFPILRKYMQRHFNAKSSGLKNHTQLEEKIITG